MEFGIFLTFFYVSKFMTNNFKKILVISEKEYTEINNLYIAALFVLGGSGLLKCPFADEGPSGLNKAQCQGCGRGIHAPYIFFFFQLHSELLEVPYLPNDS